MSKATMALHRELPVQPTTPVYGRPEFADGCINIRSGRLPEESLPPDTAYQLISDELLLDAKPGLNLATFCNETFSDPYGERIVIDSIKINFIDHTEYPGTNLAERRCIRIMATELGTRFDEDSVSSPAEEAAQGLYGSMTIGSSEAIMLGLIAHRFIWEQKHRVLLANPGLGIPVDPRDRPVVLMSSNVHGCWDKYCRYFNAVPLYIEIDGPPYALHDASVVAGLLATPIDDETSAYAGYARQLRQVIGYPNAQPGRTIGELVMCVGVALGTTFTGNYDDIDGFDRCVDEYCAAYNARHASAWPEFREHYLLWYAKQFAGKTPRRIPDLMDIPIHVDAAAPGFVLMFGSNGHKLKFNFRDCPRRVASINISNHKFGMTFPGLGSVIFKDGAVVDDSLVYHIAYLGGSFDDYTVNFSRGSSTVIMQYYNFLTFGRGGYRAIMDNCLANTRWMLDALSRDPVLGKLLKNVSNIPLPGMPPEVFIPLLALTFADGQRRPWTLVDLSDHLAQSGWVVPAYSIPRCTPEDTDGIPVLRFVVQQSVSRDKLSNLLDSLRTAVQALDSSTWPTGGDRAAQRKLRPLARHTACLC